MLISHARAKPARERERLLPSRARSRATVPRELSPANLALCTGRRREREKTKKLDGGHTYGHKSGGDDGGGGERKKEGEKKLNNPGQRARGFGRVMGDWRAKVSRCSIFRGKRHSRDS